MSPDDWKAMQAELRDAAANLAPFRPTPEGPDLLSLARELQAQNPRLSFDQAMDAATIELQELADFCIEWEDERCREWSELMAYAKQWDRAAAAHYALDLGA